MSTKICKRLDSKTQKSFSVASKCIAIVLSPEQNEAGEAPELSGKVILDDFKLRNKTCYWNPALVESIRNLEYLGYVEPHTLLVGGQDIHLENLRTAWGRRVLNDPAHFRIIRIGDIGGIKMHAIPQTQFIPLPEILCLIILDLNSKQVVATLDVIHERLIQCFCDLQSPGMQLLYETLGTLIRERKVFHNGSGYFVVTPDTYRLPSDDPQQTYPLSWMHYNPMYIPVLANQSKSMLTRSISCQVSLANQPITNPPVPVAYPQTKPTADMEPVYNDGSDSLPTVTSERTRISRSLSARRVKDRPSKDENEISKPLSRCSSVREDRGCRGRENRDINLTKSNINKVKDKGGKKSLLSKLFGRSKKKKQEKQQQQEKKIETATPPSSGTEYATFSAQFPPPEWQWYREQTEKQERTHQWLDQQQGQGNMAVGSNQQEAVSQSMIKKDTSNNVDYICPQQLFQRQQVYNLPPRHQKMPQISNLGPFTENDDGHYCQIDPRFEESLRNLRASTLLPGAFYEKNPMDYKMDPNPHIHGNSIPNRGASLPVRLPQKTEENQYVHRRYSESHSHRRKQGDRARVRRHSGDQKQILVNTDQFVGQEQDNEQTVLPNTPSFPYHTEQNYHISEPIHSSTPRGCQRDPFETIHNNTVDDLFTEKLHEPVHGRKKSSRHRNRHSFAYHHNYPVNDISYEYHGKLPKKNSIKAVSRDSGVNCIGLNKGHNPNKTRGQEKRGRPTSVEIIKTRGQTEMQPHKKGSPNNVGTLPSEVKLCNSSKNEVVCVAEINSCVPQDIKEGSPVDTTDGVVEEMEEFREVDSFVDESEQSYDTVIDSRTHKSKAVQDLCDRTKNINLGDSGFSSPRNGDNSEQFRCNKMDCNYKSMGGDNTSHHSSSSGGNPKPDKCQVNELRHENVNSVKYERADLIVLNNMKHVQREQTVLSHHMNRIPRYSANNVPQHQDGMAAVPYHFNLDGDYQVVGVV